MPVKGAQTRASDRYRVPGRPTIEPAKAPPTDSWWIGLDRASFFRKANERQKERVGEQTTTDYGRPLGKDD